MAECVMQVNFNIEAFKPNTMNWKRWIQRLEGAFQVFKVAEDAKVPYLLHYIGLTAFDMICDKVAPEDPYKETYKSLLGTLEQFYAPAPLEIAENFRFHQRKQEEGETLQDFIAALHKLSVNCKFGDYLKTALRNQFVFGLTSKRIQSRLLESQELDFDKAIKIAVSMELSEKDACQLQGTRVKGNHVYYVGDHRKRPQDHRKQEKEQSKNFVNKTKTVKIVTCFRCGGSHYANKCTMDRNITCKKCSGRGHLQKVCMKRNVETNQVEEILQLEHTEFRDKYFQKLQVNDREVTFEVDSGAAVTLMSKKQFELLFPELTIIPTELKLFTYCKTTMHVLGFVTVTVIQKKLVKMLNLYITEIDRAPLLGREWLHQLNLQLNFINSISVNRDEKLEILLDKYKSIVEPNLSKITGIQARLTLKPNAKPVFLKNRTVPFKLLPLVEKEINDLVDAQILEKVNNSQWATPVVPVLKSNNTVRLCGDFSVTINPQLIVDDHPLPTIDELFSSMAGGKTFSKIDLKQAYLQLEVAPEDRHLLTINTHKGLYVCKRLLYGVASAPAIWQREIENILKGISGVTVFLDDIKITGETDEIHLQRLEAVFERLQKYNIKINREKSEFFKDQINYCGHIIDRFGIHKSQEKIDAINKMPRPTNLTELRSFIGMINYYGRFIKNLSSLLHPLNKLLRKNTNFSWSKHCEDSFVHAKKVFQSKEFLVHYNPKLPLVVASDASPYGVGAILSHTYPDGTERVIQYASQTLSETQRKYSQIDKEAYGIIFAIKKFYQYLYGNRFTLCTDHRPLVQIFSPSKALPQYSTMRMQHYALFLMGLNYDIKYKNSKLHANADCLSRLPIKNESAKYDVVDIYQIESLETLPVTTKDLVLATEADYCLKKLKHALEEGIILDKKDRFNINQIEFTLHAGVILKGHKAVIPKSLQHTILDELHSGHFGVVKMKALARGYCWWAGMDASIEELARNCVHCNIVRNNPPKAENHLWEPASTPFERVHADFAGPFMGKSFFILVDSYTKWPEVHILNDITANSTIKKCREIFATFGIPKIFVTDNGRTFCSNEFQNFLKINGVCSKFTAPYNPATNGQAERFVQTLKKSLLSLKCENVNLDTALQKLLFQYRIMPHSSTGVSPSNLMFKRNIRSRLDLLIPENKHTKVSVNENKFSRNISVGERVECRNYIGKEKWKLGKVEKKLGKLHYLIKMDGGQLWKRHINQVRVIGGNTIQIEADETDLDYHVPDTEVGPAPVPSVDEIYPDRNREQDTPTTSDTRPKRVIQVPQKYKDYYL